MDIDHHADARRRLRVGRAGGRIDRPRRCSSARRRRAAASRRCVRPAASASAAAATRSPTRRARGARASCARSCPKSPKEHGQAAAAAGRRRLPSSVARRSSTSLARGRAGACSASSCRCSSSGWRAGFCFAVDRRDRRLHRCRASCSTATHQAAAEGDSERPSRRARPADRLPRGRPGARPGDPEVRARSSPSRTRRWPRSCG